jgi:hypothetical protein
VSRTLVERYWAAQDPYDPTALARLRHRDWSAAWPQSGERVPSHDADVAIHTSYPGYPSHQLGRLAGSDETWRALPTIPLFTPVRLSGASDFWVGEARLAYPDEGLWFAVASLDLRDGLVVHETVHYCRAADAAPWHLPLPESVPTPLPAIAASMEHDADAEVRHEAAYRSFAERAASDPEGASLALFDASATFDRPQYGARVSGAQGISRLHAEHESLASARVRRVAATGDVLVVESTFDHGGSVWFSVRILEFDGENVARATEYLAESYDAPEWRRPWTQALREDDRGR